MQAQHPDWKVGQVRGRGQARERFRFSDIQLDKPYPLGEEIGGTKIARKGSVLNGLFSLRVQDCYGIRATLMIQFLPCVYIRF